METSSYNDIGLIQTTQKSIQVGRIMLTVGIDLNQGVESTALSKEEGRPHRATDTHVKRQRHDRCSGQLSIQCSGIRGSIVDNQDVCRRLVSLDCSDDCTNRTLLVPRRDGD